MSSFSFIHAADLHLDSPFKGLVIDSPRFADILRQASFDAFDALIRLAVDNRVDFVLVAGDVYDSADRSIRAQLAFRKGMDHLKKHGIRAYVVHGNHDPSDTGLSAITWPENVHFFSSKAPETTIFSGPSGPLATITGMSFSHRREKRNLARLFHPHGNGSFNIGLLHCNVGSHTGHEPYAPCTLKDLESSPFDYWALGHVHTRQILLKQPYVVYPGNIQGRTFREPGPRGCYLVRVTDGHVDEMDFHELCGVRWFSEELDISSVPTLDGLEEAVIQRIQALRAGTPEQAIIVRFFLTGRSSLFKDLNKAGALEGIETGIREAFEEATPPVWLQALESRCLPGLDLVARMKGDDFVGQLLQIAHEWESDDIGKGHPLAEAVQGLFSNRRILKALGPLDDRQLLDLLKEAKLMVVDMLDS